MSTQAIATEVKTTGIKDADEFVSKAREMGLIVEIGFTNSEAVYFSDGRLMLPEVLTVGVTVTIPVPEELDGSYLAMMQRCNTLRSYWTKRRAPRARGRWVQGNHSTLGGHEDLHVKHRVYTRLSSMAAELQSLQKLAQD